MDPFLFLNQALGSIDSKVVNKAIREVVFPVLRGAGFTRFSARTGWRYRGDRVEVLNFQSFNGHQATVMGCTTYSFALNLGCYLTYIPQQFPAKVKEGELRPEEFRCQLRGRLRRGFEQAEVSGREIWYVDPPGLYLEAVLEDALRQIEGEGLPWFDRWARPEAVLETLLSGEESGDGLFGIGANPSPMRSCLAGFTALRVGDATRAEAKLQEAVDSGCFRNFFTSVAEAKSRYEQNPGRVGAA